MSENKTIRQWLNELSEPERSLAIAYAEDESYGTIDEEADSMVNAIRDAFLFARTAEGSQYWFNVIKKFDAQA